MMHDGVCSHRQGNNQLSINADFTSSFCDQFIDRGSHHRSHFPRTFRLHHDVGNPTHQILTKADLGIHLADRCKNISLVQVGQMKCYCSRTNIDGSPIDCFHQTGPHGNQPGLLRLCINRNRNAGAAVMQFTVKQGQHSDITIQIGKVPFLLQRQTQARKIACGFFH